ncbi:hypothetical protein D3C86_1597130 [compost metagenome]
MLNVEFCACSRASLVSIFSIGRACSILWLATIRNVPVSAVETWHFAFGRPARILSRMSIETARVRLNWGADSNGGFLVSVNTCVASFVEVFVIVFSYLL